MITNYAHSSCSSSFKIVMKRPSNSDYMWTVYTKQFEAGVWLMVVVVIVALSVVLYLVLRYSKQDDDVSVSESFFVIVVYIFGQSKLGRDKLALHRVQGTRRTELAQKKGRRRKRKIEGRYLLMLSWSTYLDWII